MAAAPAAPRVATTPPVVSHFDGPQPDVRATLPPAAPNGPHLSAASGQPAALHPIEKKANVKLRARKIGDLPPRLDVRIKRTQTRKVLATSASKVRKSAEASMSPPKWLTFAVKRKGAEKAQGRRIRLRRAEETLLASTRAATKIFGVPHRRPRILPLAHT